MDEMFGEVYGMQGEIVIRAGEARLGTAGVASPASRADFFYWCKSLEARAQRSAHQMNRARLMRLRHMLDDDMRSEPTMLPL